MRDRTWVLVLPLIGLIGLTPAAPVLKMALISLSIFLLLKWHSLRTYEAAGHDAGSADRIQWFLTWPGLEPVDFFAARAEVPRPYARQWTMALVKMLLGIALCAGVAPRLASSNALAAGWVALVGIALALHFGLFHLLALAWRRAGRNVTPIMNCPPRAAALAEFWNCRWNLAFRDFTNRHVFRPLTRRLDAVAATWLSFAFSGGIHELAISIPARAGFGLPMFYFLLQAVGVTVERHALRQAWWKRGGVGGRCYALAFVVAPACILFHPPFIERVVLPLIGC